MRTLRKSLVVVVIVMVSVCASDMVSIADNYSGGRNSGGYYRGGGYGGDHSGGYYRGGGHRGGYYWGGYGGVVLGSPYWGAAWNYPYYYPYYNPYYYPYEPAVTVPSEYIKRSQDESEPASSGVWYFCSDSKAYYPYVRECPGGWQTVPAQPLSESGR